MKCPCLKIRESLVSYRNREELPRELRDALERCPDCRAFWEETLRIAGLMSLKQYERPTPQSAIRCRAAVRQSIQEWQAAQSREEADIWWGIPLPVFRFGMAAMLLALLGLHMISANYLTPIQTETSAWIQTTPEPAAPAAEAILVAEEERPNPEFNIMMLSNWMPRVEQNSAYQFVGFDR